ncbi:MAG TPA: hypothetical protein PLI45_04670 [Candidatus Woesebacteria bacterium]|nr:hypothetical protein [Candidatus Woesebacteria bacterium]
MKSILPIIFIILVLVGGITYSLIKRSVPVKPVDNMGIAANQLEGNTDSIVSPTPKSTFGSINTTAVISNPTTLPVVTEKAATKSIQNSVAVQTSVTKTTICTPVYGSADTCTEHVVVDTGAENAIFFNLAGLAYIGGLLSFAKAKRLKK